MKNYSVDLETISLDTFKTILTTKRLLPSRTVLLDNIDKNFSWFSENSYLNMEELIKCLNSKKKQEEIANRSGISPDYIVLLLREAKSYISKPINLDKFTDISSSLISDLIDLNIKNTKDFFLFVHNRDNIKSIDTLKEQYNDFDQLASYCDIARINGIGAAFAKILYDLKIVSVKIFKEKSIDEIYDITQKEIQDKNMKNIKILKNDIEFCCHYAQYLD